MSIASEISRISGARDTIRTKLVSMGLAQSTDQIDDLATVIDGIAVDTDGTPTATKGAVSNHSVAVTPSVTNTAGYISGGTKTGTAVTVVASELVSGTKSITANGTGIDVADYATVDVDVPSSGSGPVSRKQVNFIDYDGTLLYSYTAQEANALASLPANPSHSGLIAQGWNWTLAQIKAQLLALPDGLVWVGQMYLTESGDTEIDVQMQQGRLSPTMTVTVDGTITVDWGDNTTPDTVTGTSVNTRLAVPHTYAAPGNYTIKIHFVSGQRFAFYGTGTYTLLRKNTTAYENRVYANTIQAVRIGSGITGIGSYTFVHCTSLSYVTMPSSITYVNTYAFDYCFSLSSITIPSGVTSIHDGAFYSCCSLASISTPSSVTAINASAFYNCYSLISITLPSGLTTLGEKAFYYCSSLISITIPAGITSLGTQTFYYCYSLYSVVLPSSMTSIGSQAFNTNNSLTFITLPSGLTTIEASAFASCFSLVTVTFPSNVTAIKNLAFNYCSGVSEVHLKPTTPPTLGGNVFLNTSSDLVIYVPAESLEAYQTASGWSYYASQMQGE